MKPSIPVLDSPLLRKCETFLDAYVKLYPTYARDYDDATLSVLLYDFVKWIQSQQK